MLQIQAYCTGDGVGCVMNAWVEAERPGEQATAPPWEKSEMLEHGWVHSRFPKSEGEGRAGEWHVWHWRQVILENTVRGEQREVGGGAEALQKDLDLQKKEEKEEPSKASKSLPFRFYVFVFMFFHN